MNKLTHIECHRCKGEGIKPFNGQKVNCYACSGTGWQKIVKWYCCYCGIELNSRIYTIEHLVPLSKGGNNRAANKFPCCKSCNNKRSNYSYTHWIKSLKNQISQGHINRTDGEVMIENIERWKNYVDKNKDKLYRSQMAALLYK